MAQGAIQNRLMSSLHQSDKSEALDLHAKLSIQAKQNTLPKVIFGPPSQPLANDLERLRTKYIVLTPKQNKFKLQSNGSDSSDGKSQHLVPAEKKIKMSPKMESSLAVKSNDGIPEPRRSFFPLEKVSNKWSSNAKGLSGLYNMGNTCYLNASLQCLMHTPSLFNILMLPENHPARQGRV